MHPFLTIADRAAREAGKHIVHSLKRLDRLKVYEKNPNDFVTEVDYAVENVLIQKIQEAYPDHGILSEERGYSEGSSDYVWIIDPIDGTTNFMYGLPGFAISIAIQHKGQTEQALVYDPLAQETFYASRGQKARLYQQRLKVKERTSLTSSLVYMTQSYDPKLMNTWQNITKQLCDRRVKIRTLGSNVLGLTYVAAGRLDGFISISPLKPWDLEAGALLIQEAGGMFWDAPFAQKDQNENKIVIAANPRLCEKLAKEIHV